MKDSERSEPSAKAKTTTWTEHWKAKGKAFGIEAKPGESDGDYCRRVQAFAKDRP